MLWLLISALLAFSVLIPSCLKPAAGENQKELVINSSVDLKWALPCVLFPLASACVTLEPTDGSLKIWVPQAPRQPPATQNSYVVISVPLLSPPSCLLIPHFHPPHLRNLELYSLRTGFWWPDMHPVASPHPSVSPSLSSQQLIIPRTIITFSLLFSVRPTIGSNLSCRF